MDRIEVDSQRKKIINKTNTFTIPYSKSFIKDDISIKTNQLNILSKEEIINYGFKAHSTGNIKEAAKYYQLFINKGFNDARIFSNYGIILNTIGKSKEAEMLTRKAIELNPVDAIAQSNLGNILKDIGKFEEAKICYEKAIELKPDLAMAHSNLGNILREIGKYEEAIISLNKASNLDPDNPTYYSNRDLKLSDLYRETLKKNHNLIESINNYDWLRSKSVLDKVCNETPKYIKDNINEFIKLWCCKCKELVNQNAIDDLLKILINLIIINESNEDINDLIKYVFDRFKINSILKFVNGKDKILLTLGYFEYKFIKKEFFEIEDLAANIFSEAEILIKDKGTEDLGWLTVRRTLALFNRKDFAKKNLMNLVNNLTS